jgi:hypothetical protein
VSAPAADERAEYIQALVNEAPQLTSEQTSRLTTLLDTGEDTPHDIPMQRERTTA